ncbi:MAG: hypothetical protein V3U88_12370 [Methylococcales bacterium]
MIQRDKLSTSLLFLALVCCQSIAEATNRHHYPDRQNIHVQSWYDWARLVRVEPEIKIVRVPFSRYECDYDGYDDRRYQSRNHNPLGVSDAVRDHLEKAEGRSYNLRRRLTPKQRYQQKNQSSQLEHRGIGDCRASHSGRKKRVRYYRICYVYRGQEYYSTLNYYPESPIRVHVTAIPANRSHYGEPFAYSYEVTPADHRY